MVDDFEMKIQTEQIISQHIFNWVQVQIIVDKAKGGKMFCVKK